MNRFRAWDDEAGEFTYSFIQDDNYIWGFEDGKLRAWAVRLNPGTIDEPPYPESIELEPPEMSTGLKDKNGKEIFEGDVVNEVGADNPLQVKWDELKLSYRLVNGAFDLCLYSEDELEIIGNGWENPELLESP